MSNVPETRKSIIFQMLQACKNIMSVTLDYNNIDDIKDTDFVLNNVYMNLSILIELYAKNPSEEKGKVMPSEDVRGYADFIKNEFNIENLPKIMYVCKNVVPPLKNKLEEIYATL